jgi:hypothetical protein
MQTSTFLFIALQMLRTNEQRVEMELVYDKVIDKLAEKRSKNRHIIENMIPTDSESMKRSHLSVLLLAVPEFATILADKVWVILQNDTDTPLWTSDNPVMLSNRINYAEVVGIDILHWITSKMPLENRQNPIS